MTSITKKLIIPETSEISCVLYGCIILDAMCQTLVDNHVEYSNQSITTNKFWFTSFLFRRISIFIMFKWVELTQSEIEQRVIACRFFFFQSSRFRSDFYHDCRCNMWNWYCIDMSNQFIEEYRRSGLCYHQLLIDGSIRAECHLWSRSHGFVLIHQKIIWNSLPLVIYCFLSTPIWVVLISFHRRHHLLDYWSVMFLARIMVLTFVNQVQQVNIVSN